MTEVTENTIQNRLPQFYRELHEADTFRGDSWQKHYKRFIGFLGNTSGKILDYGCGPTGGLSSKLEDRVIPYDPYLPKFSSPPWNSRFSTFFSCDVFEHLLKDDIFYLLKILTKRKDLEKLYIVAATRPANKFFSNGLNIHLIVEPSSWWRGLFEARLSGEFDLVIASDDMIRGEAVFAATRRTK